MADLVAVGRVLRPQGRLGEVRLESLTDSPARFRALRECWLVPPEEGEHRTVLGVRFQGDTPVVKLHGSEGIDDARALAGRLVTVPRAMVPALGPDRYYAFDLVGCRVEAADGTRLGEVADVLASPAHDLWVVRDGGREWLLPAVTAIVETVDLAARRVVVCPPPGLTVLEGEGS